MTSPPSETPARQARTVMRATDRAALATSQGGWPFASLVLAALDHDGTPLLLISDLSEHAKNIKREPRVSLLFDGTRGFDDPLTGPRVTVLGEAQASAEKRLLQRFLARHPAAELYAGFADFHLYRIAVTRAHLVAGFGRIHWIEASDLLPAVDPRWTTGEAELVSTLNGDPSRLQGMLTAYGLTGEWHFTGIDPEGADLRNRGNIGRLEFATVLQKPGDGLAALAQATLTTL
ncbi:MAG TPA: pyridoxamine 5'-phosphate oxidase family protein [Stellaceae bacterium]|nr:pyridoxamine 5'-phosphate oxidase family protein [Stellaceae bacterium]